MTHIEYRKMYRELMNETHGLQQEIFKMQMKSAELLRELNQITTKLINAAESHLGGAIDEHDITRGGSQTKKITYNSTPTARVDTTQPNLSAPPSGGRMFKRACSYCREPGHRATTCEKKAQDELRQRKGK